MSDVQQRIDELVKGNEVLLFMKGNASFPMCGFSGRAIQVLKACGVDAKSISTVIANAEWDQVRTVGSECRCGVCNSPTCADRHRVLPACLLRYRHCAAQEPACLSVRGACQHFCLWAAP